MPEFSAGAIWIEVDGKRLDEHGERVEVLSAEQEAKECFINLSDHVGECKLMFNYQWKASSSEREEPDALLCESFELAEGEGSAGPRAHTYGYELSCSVPRAESVAAFRLELFGESVGRNTKGIFSPQELLSKYFRPSALKIVISPRRLEENEGEDSVWLGKYQSPDSPWPGGVMYGAHERWWGIMTKTGRLHHGFLSTELKHRQVSGFPQISALFHLCFEGFPPATCSLNPDGTLVSPISLPKTISKYDGDRPALPPPRLHSQLSAAAGPDSAREAPDTGATHGQLQAPSTELLRCRAENQRLSAELVQSEKKCRALERGEHEGRGVKRTGGEEIMTTTAKKLHVEATPDGELKIQYDMGSDVKGEEKEEKATVSVKKEDCEVRVKQEPTGD